MLKSPVIWDISNHCKFKKRAAYTNKPLHGFIFIHRKWVEKEMTLENFALLLC